MSFPRINKALLPNFIGSNVKLVGRVTEVDASGRFASIEAADHGIIQVIRDPSAQRYGSPYVEITGGVNPDGTINEYNFADFGDNFSKSVL
jgi:hypothetical protein